MEVRWRVRVGLRLWRSTSRAIHECARALTQHNTHTHTKTEGEAKGVAARSCRDTRKLRLRASLWVQLCVRVCGCVQFLCGGNECQDRGTTRHPPCHICLCGCTDKQLRERERECVCLSLYKGQCVCVVFGLGARKHLCMCVSVRDRESILEE